MRFITKLSAFSTLLVVLAMFLMLLGSTFSFFYMSQQKMEQRLGILATSIDQIMLTKSSQEVEDFVPLMMRSLDVTEVSVTAAEKKLHFFNLSAAQPAWEVESNLRVVSYPMIHFAGTTVKITYIDPVAVYTRSLRSTAPITLAIMAMSAVLLLSFRWLNEQTRGQERLERRAQRILSGDRESVVQGDVHEWPPNASSAIDLLLADLRESREERSRIDTLIRAFAAQDAKTGLNNRLFFDNQLTTQLEDEGAHGIVMLIRLPDFDILRDIHGNSAVQEMMFWLVNMLSTFVMRYPSALLARYFHSDFAVLLPHRTLKEADVIAAQLVKATDALPTTFSVDRESLLYIGICAYRSGQTCESVMDHAEQATRMAVLQGDNGWSVFDSQVPEKGRGSVKWRTLLEQTLARGGPRLYQQPVVTIDGQVHCREILTRIYDGEQELLPAEYVPLIQQLGLAESYDRQLISRIIPLLSLWPDESLACPLNVDSLLQRAFQRWLRDTLMQCEKSQRRRIMFELAEADVCQHIDRLRPMLRLLTALGCRICVSQAGLTVVSTSYLKMFEVEQIKLHQGLVRSIDRRTENQLFVQSLTSACAGAHIKVFAAGVRSQHEWQTLKDKGIFGGQGDFFAAAQPVTGERKKYSRRYRV